MIIPGGIGTGKNNMGVPVLEQLVKLLSKEFDVTVFSLFKINESYRPDNFQLIGINGHNFVSRSMNLVATFKRLHANRKFSVVHGFWAMPSGFFAVCLAKIFRLKSIVSILGGDAISLPEIGYGQLQKTLNKKLIFWTLRQADEVISLTRYLIGNLNNLNFYRNDIKVIPWGIDTRLFTYKPRRSGDVIQFYHIANLHPVKDQLTLLKAFRLIADHIPARLTIIGEGADLNRLESWIADLRLEKDVVRLDQLAYNSLPHHYHQADVLLHTSLSEGQSEVVTEAMSCGVIVCGTSVGLMYDLPECCFSVPVHDYENLAKGVLNLLGDTDRLNEIRERAHAWCSAHSIEWTAGELAKVYRSLYDRMPRTID